MGGGLKAMMFALGIAANSAPELGQDRIDIEPRLLAFIQLSIVAMIMRRVRGKPPNSGSSNRSPIPHWQRRASFAKSTSLGDSLRSSEGAPSGKLNIDHQVALVFKRQEALRQMPDPPSESAIMRERTAHDHDPTTATAPSRRQSPNTRSRTARDAACRRSP
jgi:hypothetical protein